MLRLDWDLISFGMVRNKTRAFCNSDAQAPPIAEFVVASVLNHWHQFSLRAEHQKNHRWQGTSFREMLGSNWLIIGFGNIGQRIARQVKGFGGNVTALRRNVSDPGLADQVDSLIHVYMTPHASNRGLGTQDRGDVLFVENLNNYLSGRPLRNLVNHEGGRAPPI